jgi:hypothetical protein
LEPSLSSKDLFKQANELVGLAGLLLTTTVSKALNHLEEIKRGKATSKRFLNAN